MVKAKTLNLRLQNVGAQTNECPPVYVFKKSTGKFNLD